MNESAMTELPHSAAGSLEEKRERILRTLLAILNSGRDLESIAVDEITEAVDMSRASFYQCFVSKETAVIALYEEVYLRESAPEVMRRLGREHNPNLALCDIGAVVVDKFIHMPRNYPKLSTLYNRVRVAAEVSPEHGKRYEKHIRAEYDLLFDRLSDFAADFPNEFWREMLVLRAYGTQAVIDAWYLGTLDPIDAKLARAVDEKRLRREFVNEFVSHLTRSSARECEPAEK